MSRGGALRGNKNESGAPRARRPIPGYPPGQNPRFAGRFVSFCSVLRLRAGILWQPNRILGKGHRVRKVKELISAAVELMWRRITCLCDIFSGIKPRGRAGYATEIMTVPAIRSSICTAAGLPHGVIPYWVAEIFGARFRHGRQRCSFSWGTQARMSEGELATRRSRKYLPLGNMPLTLPPGNEPLVKSGRRSGGSVTLHPRGI